MGKLIFDRCIMTVAERSFTDQSTGKVQKWNELTVTDNTGRYTLSDGGWDLSEIPTLLPVSAQLEVEQSDFGRKSWKLAKRSAPVVTLIK